MYTLTRIITGSRIQLQLWGLFSYFVPMSPSFAGTAKIIQIRAHRNKVMYCSFYHSAPENYSRLCTYRVSSEFVNQNGDTLFVRLIRKQMKCVNPVTLKTCDLDRNALGVLITQLWSLFCTKKSCACSKMCRVNLWSFPSVVLNPNK